MGSSSATSITADPPYLFTGDGGDVTITAEVAALEGTVVSVTADLSALGGSAAATLTNAGGNTYRTTLTVSAGAAAGACKIPVQATDGNGIIDQYEGK